MRFPTAKPKPRKTQITSFPVPTAGLISNRNIAMPDGDNAPPGAAVMSNWFPTPSSVVLRRGLRRWATLPNGLTVRSLFSYALGQDRRLFGATDSGIWDITSIANPFEIIIGTDDDDMIGTDDDEVFGEPSSLGEPVFTEVTNGDWVTVQFSTPSATFVIGVNGVDQGFIFDGQTFWPYVEGGVSDMAVTGTFSPGETITGDTSDATAVVHSVDGSTIYVTDIDGEFEVGEDLTGDDSGSGTVVSLPLIYAPGVTGISSDRMSYVWAYKQRLFFIERDTLDMWYLPVDQVGGEATVFPMGGVFNRGGTLLFGQTWSLDSGGSGGLSEQCIFVTTEGEVAAFQGLSPDVDQGWSKVGVYRIGRPMGKKAFIRAGGDLVVATSIGFIPLGHAIKRDYAALGLVSISNPIADDWRRAVTERGTDGWICELWGEGSMVFVCPPTPADMEPVVFVTNSDSGAWSLFTGWRPTATEVFQGRIIMGTISGKVHEAWAGGSDDGAPFTGDLMPLFTDLGTPGNRKIAQMCSVVKRSSFPSKEKVAARFDWDMKVPTAPDAAPIAGSSVWDLGVWDESLWNSERGSFVTEDWHSVGGSGYAASVVVQVTSASTVPIDVELVRVDFTYGSGDIVT